jgi:hypothetical protein
MLSRGVIFTESILLPLIIELATIFLGLAWTELDGVAAIPFNAIMHALNVGSSECFNFTAHVAVCDIESPRVRVCYFGLHFATARLDEDQNRVHLKRNHVKICFGDVSLNES